jgi:hypothetical protein
MMNLAVIHDPTESLPARGPATRADAPGMEGATSTTVNALEPRERVRGLVAARLFGEIARPSRVDRFELQRELGVGGMGAVYAAHDPRLDRVVALKILQRAGGGVQAGQRLLREAQAMARLRHPNVVQVYEAGTHGGQVYIAMELIEGGTLGEWMRGRPRPWRDVRDVMMAAGRGLAAAHAAGLVHRDFKPGNVLMDVDGQPRVSDFGLARGAEEEDAVVDEAEVTAEISRGGLLDVVLTRTGAVLGTPAYMSPEQFRGEPATPRSDQFAFCVVVWEALAGQRPFIAETAGGLLAKVEAGAITRPHGVRIPRRVRRILERGLSPAPGDRYPSMKVLLDELGRVRCRRSESNPRVWAASVMAASMILGTALLAADRKEEARAAEPTEATSTTGGSFVGVLCAHEQRELATAWSPEVVDGLRARLAAAAEGVGAEGFDIDATVAAIDRRFVALRDATEARCAERIAAPDSRHDLVDLCLEDRRRGFTDMLASLEGASPMELRTLDGLVSMVPDVSECALERPPRSSMGTPASRAERWQARRRIAWAFLPRALARDVIDHSSWTDAFTVANRYDDKRLAYEAQLAGAIALGQTTEIAVAPGSGWAQTLDRMSATDGYREQIDVQARARALLLELDERAPHSVGMYARASEAASSAVDALPDDHPLRRPLSRDLGVLNLAHAKHAGIDGGCVGTEVDASCLPVLRAAGHLRDYVARTEAASTGESPEVGEALALLAEAEALRGATEVAQSLRARAVRLGASVDAGALEERLAAAYPQLAEGEIVEASALPEAAAQPEVELPGDREALREQVARVAIRCTGDRDRRCEVDRDYFAADLARIADIGAQGTRTIAIVEGGEMRGYALYGLRSKSALRLLGARNGDRIVAVNGTALSGYEVYDQAVSAALDSGEITFTLEDREGSREIRIALRPA